MKNILVTGGTGFIGSHTCVELLDNGYNVVIIDNLINSKKNVVDKIKQITNNNIIFYEIDLFDKYELLQIFTKHKFDCVMHFAGLKAVAESVNKPLLYYKNNIMITLNLLELMEKFKCYNLIFSSSATVYGNQKPPFKEDMNIGQGITNPYGQTKYMIEQILKDLCISNNKFNVTCLRYFNPVGAHPSGLIGEDPNGIPNNLMPVILKVAIKNNLDSDLGDRYKNLNIFGNDYNTKDGTCLRDYIHVVDLAQGHVKTLNNMDGYKVYNLGTGKGISVLDIINKFTEINKVDLPYKIVGKRDGDLAEVYCDPSLVKDELGWEAKLGLENMCRDSWNFI